MHFKTISKHIGIVLKVVNLVEHFSYHKYNTQLSFENKT